MGALLLLPGSLRAARAARRLCDAEGGRVRVSKVEVWENQGSLAVYREE